MISINIVANIPKNYGSLPCVEYSSLLKISRMLTTMIKSTCGFNILKGKISYIINWRILSKRYIYV